MMTERREKDGLVLLGCLFEVIFSYGKQSRTLI
jgi:hypothetical protein